MKNGKKDDGRHGHRTLPRHHVNRVLPRPRSVPIPEEMLKLRATASTPGDNVERRNPINVDSGDDY